MKSAYFQEQRIYSRREIIQHLSIDDQIADVFFERILAANILKLLKKEAAQYKHREEILAGDYEIGDIVVSAEEKRYVFNFVGVVEIGIGSHCFILKCYPKYFSSPPDFTQMKLIASVLQKYNAEEFSIVLAADTPDKKRYNQLAITLFILQDYLEHGVYTRTKEELTKHGSNEIDWDITINETFPVLQNGRPFYVDYFTRETSDDESSFITRLHQYAITECTRRLKETELDVLFGIEAPEIYDGGIEDFGEIEFIKQRIISEINIQFVTQKQQLLRTLYAFFSKENYSEDNANLSLFGTNSFNMLWEKACASVFGNVMDTPICRLPLPQKSDSTQLLKDLIPRPEWKYITGESFKSDTLKPDIINLCSYKGKTYFVIQDAKYYNLHFSEIGISGQPGIEAINKQFLYQAAFSAFIKKYQLDVCNMFIFPSDENDVSYRGEVLFSLPIFADLSSIKIILLPAEIILQNYLSNTPLDLEEIILRKIYEV